MKGSWVELQKVDGGGICKHFNTQVSKRSWSIRYMGLKLCTFLYVSRAIDSEVEEPLRS